MQVLAVALEAGLVLVLEPRHAGEAPHRVRLGLRLPHHLPHGHQLRVAAVVLGHVQILGAAHGGLLCGGLRHRGAR